MNAPLAPWWHDLRADDFLCGRQSPAQRDAAMETALRPAREQRRRELAEQGRRTAARINATAAFMAPVRRSPVHWEEHPSPQPEELF